MSSILILFTTLNSKEEAQKLACAVLEHKLAGCIQIDKIESFYSWQGSIEQNIEYRLIIKAELTKKDALTDFIKNHHPYDIPQLITLTAEANKEYASWIKNI